MEQLGTQCVACGTRRKHKNLVYDAEHFQAYCENAYLCNQEHPNSPIKLIKRQTVVDMISYEQARADFKATIVVEVADKVKRILTYPLSIRIHDPDMANFLVKHAEITEQNVSDLVRGFIQTMMERYDNFTSSDKPKTTPVAKPKPIEIDPDDLIF